MPRSFYYGRPACGFLLLSFIALWLLPSAKERRFFSLSGVVLFFAKMLYVLVRPLLHCSRFVSLLFTCKKDRRDGEEVDEGLHRQREHNLVVGSDESEKIFLNAKCAKRCADCYFFFLLA